jgi:hypothetical protein
MKEIRIRVSEELHSKILEAKKKSLFPSITSWLIAQITKLLK